MEQKKQDDKKDKYDLDEDTSSFSPEIEEESNEEEEESSQKKEESNKNQNSPLMDKLISIQKKMDINQNRTKYPLYNYKENNNTDNNINKNIYKNNSNNNMNYYNNSRNNKNTLNLNESEQEEDDNNNNSSEPSYKNQQNKIKAKQQNNQYYPQNQEQSSITKKEEENKKCYAFVRFSTKESANLALKLDSTRLNSRNIKVTKSNENATIFIGNIRKSWTKEELETKIRRIFHNINKIEFFTDPGNPTKNRGFCFGIFNTRNEAIKALNYVNKKGGINIDGISITCDWADVVDEDDNSKSNQIFISNIKKEVSEYDLKKYFEKFEKVLSVIMSKNHLNSKRKDLAFITFESHESAVSAIQKFEEEKKNEKMEKNLKKIFYLAENENVNMIQVSLAFSQEAMQNKKKIKDNRKKVPSQISKGNSTNNINDNNINNNHRSNNNTNNNNNNNKTSGKTFMGNISMNAQNEYKNYSSGHRSKNYQRHEHGRSHNYIGANKNVHDLFSSLNNNNKNIYGNQMNNYSGNKNNSNIDNNLYNQLNQLYSNSIEKTTNAFMNTNNNNNINNNLNQNPLSALTNLINLCQQNPNLLQQMTNMYNSNIGTNNEFVEINNEKKFLNRKRNSNNNYLENNLNNNNMNNNNEIQNNNYLNISQTQNQNQNIISQFPYIQNIPPVSPINNPNVSNIQNLQIITNFN